VRVLAIDTASRTQSAALYEDGRVLSLAGLSGAAGGSENVLLLASRVLECANADLSGLDAIAVSRGPGSLTGLRVGIGTARGLAVGSGCPLVGVSTLQALAVDLGPGAPVLALIDAGRGEVYGGLFRPGEPPHPLGDESVGTPEWFASAVEGRSVRIAGSGALRYRDLFPRAAASHTLGGEFLAPGVARVAAVVHPRAGADEAWDASPRYLLRARPPVHFEE
jgi:tRNA threonylcarbamoyladenosine biosynthesis protein TsaB